ncbi:MAG TPA: class I SAM-dependent methyltransferase [Roseiflexaceae bacterium]|nr:class I SAM-dependent methyltransferase [Roseiflexaceae bacterium]HMP39323.1 class I SAM-dependent methyltransferase [Roseiflexaceae bacterium]
MDVTLAERHKVEQQFHDHVAGRERTDFYAWGALDAADAYARSLIDRPAGARILDLGCGDGENTLYFAERGAQICAIDISAGQVGVTRQRVARAGYSAQVSVQQMSGEYLGFADGTFDYVFGHSVMHHTDLAITRNEIRRILRPGGRAIFLEPLDHNPLLQIFRRLTPNRRTPTERPLSMRDITFFAEPFAAHHHREFYLLALAAWGFVPLRMEQPYRAALAALNLLDRALFALRPDLGRFAWVTVIALTR